MSNVKGVGTFVSARRGASAPRPPAARPRDVVVARKGSRTELVTVGLISETVQTRTANRRACRS